MSPRTARTHNSNKESHSSQCNGNVSSQKSCKTKQKARSSVYCRKLAVMAKPILVQADYSRQMWQLPGRQCWVMEKMSGKKLAAAVSIVLLWGPSLTGINF